jgi:hypothetical protein
MLLSFAPGFARRGDRQAQNLGTFRGERSNEVKKPQAVNSSGPNRGNLRQQLRRVLPVLLLGALFVLLVAGAAAAVILHENVPSKMLTSDPASFTDSPWWLGALSNLGLLLLAGSAGIWGVVGYLARRPGSSSQSVHFLLVSALLSVALAIDDTYMLHDSVLPGLGVPERAVYLAYGLAALAFVTFFRRTWLRTDYLIMFAAFAGFGLSVVLDSFWRVPRAGYIEDCFGLAGIVYWFLYAASASVFLFREEHAPVAATPSQSGDDQDL